MLIIQGWNDKRCILSTPFGLGRPTKIMRRYPCLKIVTHQQIDVVEFIAKACNI